MNLHLKSSAGPGSFKAKEKIGERFGKIDGRYNFKLGKAGNEQIKLTTVKQIATALILCGRERKPDEDIRTDR